MVMVAAVNKALLARVQLGNDRLIEAWLSACEVVSDQVEWDRRMDILARAFVKLHYLCLQLIGQAYDGCLYSAQDHRNCIEADSQCWVCPKRPCPTCGGAQWRHDNGKLICTRCNADGPACQQ